MLIKCFFDANADIVTPRQAVKAMFPYIEKQLSQGVYLNHIVRHMLGAFQKLQRGKTMATLFK